jgi:hypothetical protein
MKFDVNPLPMMIHVSVIVYTVLGSCSYVVC